jgi:cyclopropane fatty-acyl-phospholipid synthase-like methyltransferase
MQTAEAPSNLWTEYWKKDRFWSASELWKKNAAICFERISRFVPLHAADAVLDIGCGAGYLEKHLASRVARIHAVDTSESFVAQCRVRCEGLPNISTGILGENYTDLRPFGKFSLFLCVSVVQYYRDLTEVRDLILSAKAQALPGARMLIADLPVPANGFRFFMDAARSIWSAAKGGYLILLLKTWVNLRRTAGEYKKLKRKKPELSFSEAQMLSLVQELGLSFQWIRPSLSVYAGRPSLLIQF